MLELLAELTWFVSHLSHRQPLHIDDECLIGNGHLGTNGILPHLCMTLFA